MKSEFNMGDHVFHINTCVHGKIAGITVKNELQILLHLQVPDDLHYWGQKNMYRVCPTDCIMFNDLTELEKLILIT